MRLNKTFSQKLNQRRKVVRVQVQAAPQNEVSLGDWRITTNDDGSLIIRHSETGQEIVLAEKE